MIQAVEDGTDRLPHWLTFDEKKKKLQGIPMESDVQKGLKVVFTRTDNKAKKDTKTLILDVISNTEPFRCKEISTVASVIFHADLKSMTTLHDILKFMRHFSQRFDMISIHDLHIEQGNKMDGNGLLNSQIRMAGPGDRHITGSQPGFTISWKLKCSVDISGKLISIILFFIHSNELFLLRQCNQIVKIILPFSFFLKLQVFCFQRICKNKQTVLLFG